MNIKQLLKTLGFSQNQSQIYLSTLELDQASAQVIARHANLPRTSVYSILEKLIERGVVGKTLAQNKTKFVAEPPRKLLFLLEQMKNELELALPELEARFNTHKTKPKIIFYEGADAIQKVYDDTLEEKPEEILEWNTDAYFDFQKYKVDPVYIVKRMDLNIKAKRIAGEKSKWDTKHKHYDDSELSKTIIVPRNIFWPGIEVNIYNNKVAFLNYDEQMSLIIESKAIADAMRQAYYLSWVGAKTLEINEEK
jgi:sugar-specific transcriptional regulator TrmB